MPFGKRHVVRRGSGADLRYGGENDQRRVYNGRVTPVGTVRINFKLRAVVRMRVEGVGVEGVGGGKGGGVEGVGGGRSRRWKG